MNVLFVCTGNISRSFLAEVLFRHEMEGLDRRDFCASSAGLHAYPGTPPDPQMVRHLAEQGILIPPHGARSITREIMEGVDLILAMEGDQAQEIRHLWPEAGEKVALLGSYLPGLTQGDDIPDPFGRTPYHYRLARSQITLAVKSLVKSLLSASAKGASC